MECLKMHRAPEKSSCTEHAVAEEACGGRGKETAAAAAASVKTAGEETDTKRGANGRTAWGGGVRDRQERC